MWPTHVYPSSTIARNAKYAFLVQAERKYALNVALIYIVTPLLCLDIIIVLAMVVLRLRETFTGKAAA